MKQFLFCLLPLFISFQLSAQFTDKFPPNMLFTKATEFGYEDEFAYWQVYNERQPNCTTRYELRGYFADGEHGLTLKLSSAQYCRTCDEVLCEYNGIKFSLLNRVKNGSNSK